MSKKEMNKIRIALFSRLKYLIVRRTDGKFISHAKAYNSACEKCVTFEKKNPNIHNKTHWTADYYLIGVTDIAYKSNSYYKFINYIREKLEEYNVLEKYTYSGAELFEIESYIIDYFLTNYFER